MPQDGIAPSNKYNLSTSINRTAKKATHTEGPQKPERESAGLSQKLRLRIAKD